MAKKSIKQREPRAEKAGAKMSVNIVLIAFGKDGTVHLRKRAAAPLKGRMELPYAPLRDGQTMLKAAQELMKAEVGGTVSVANLKMIGAYQPAGASAPKKTIWIAYAAPYTKPLNTPLAQAKKTALAFGHSPMLADAIQRVKASVKVAAVVPPAAKAAKPAAEAPAKTKKRLGQGLEEIAPSPQPVNKVAGTEEPRVKVTTPTPKPNKVLNSFQAILVRDGEEGLRTFLTGLSRSTIEASLPDQRLSGLTVDQLRAAPSDSDAIEMVVKAVKITYAQRRAAGS